MKKEDNLFFSKKSHKHAVKARMAGDQLIVRLEKPERDSLWVMVAQEDRCHGLLKFLMAADYFGWFLDGAKVSVVDVNQQIWRSGEEGFAAFTETLLKDEVLVLQKGGKASASQIAAVQGTTSAFQTRQAQKAQQ